MYFDRHQNIFPNDLSLYYLPLFLFFFLKFSGSVILKLIILKLLYPSSCFLIVNKVELDLHIMSFRAIEIPGNKLRNEKLKNM